MKEKIIANDRDHLRSIIESEMILYGDKCDLNHIDVSNQNSMMWLFSESKFNGDISKWDVSNVTNMSSLFNSSKFDGDISSWNTSHVHNMRYLFSNSEFNGYVSSWRPLKLETTKDMFLNCLAHVPYWFGNNNEEIVKNIESYDLFKKMNKELYDKEEMPKRLKI